MPEIAEVARIVHFVRKHLVDKTLSHVSASDDPNVYGKVGTSASEFQKCLTGKKVVGAGQQGKYFWIEMSSPPHPLMHFGMTGWLKIRSEDTYYYRQKEGSEKEEWPPRFMKFLLKTGSDPPVEAAFVDSRRFSRIRLLHCPAAQIRKIEPLSVNGPDPVVDKDTVTSAWLIDLCRSKKVPIKALLLDQANISGIGNWVGDEIMYDAKIHPEQYSNTLSDAQLKQLCKSIHYICGTAVELLGDSEQFPDHWLFKHRWGKGKKDAPKQLPNGEKIVHVTVGGRTSAVIPSVQKKTGPVAGEVDEAESQGGVSKVAGGVGKKKTKGKKAAVDGEDDRVDGEEEKREEEKLLPAKKKKASGGKRKRPENDEDAERGESDDRDSKSKVNNGTTANSSSSSSSSSAAAAAAKSEKKKKLSKETKTAPPPPAGDEAKRAPKKANVAQKLSREEDKKRSATTEKKKKKEDEKAPPVVNGNGNGGSYRRRSARLSN